MNKLDRWIDQQNAMETPKPVDLTGYLTETAANDLYLGKTEEARDSAKLGGVVAANYALKTDIPAQPTWQYWTPTLTGWSDTPTVYARYMKSGKTVHFVVSVSGTSNSGDGRISLPFRAANIHTNVKWLGVCQGGNSGGYIATPGKWQIDNNGTEIITYADFAGTGWHTSGYKSVQLEGFYESAT